MCSEFPFKSLDCVSPVDRFSRLVGISDIFAERGFKGLRVDKMIGLQVFALQHTEPDFDLIQPGGIGRQPEHLKVESPFRGVFLLTEPAFELLRRMRRAIIQDEGHGVDAPSQCLGNDFLLHKGLEIDKAFATAAGSVDLPVSDGQPGKEMSGATTMVARFVEEWLSWACWARRLFPFSCLNGRFLIQANQPASVS